MSTAIQEVTDFWAKVDERADARISKALELFAANYRPRGANSLALVLGTPGVPIVASLTLAWLFVKVPFPLVARDCHIVADVAGSMTFDIWVQRPKQTPAMAASIVGGMYPALVAQQQVIIDPSIAGWPNQPTYIEPGSIVSVYVTATDGLIGQATVNLGGRAV